jgi:hypothetical protein
MESSNVKKTLQDRIDDLSISLEEMQSYIGKLSCDDMHLEYNQMVIRTIAIYIDRIAALQRDINNGETY